MTYSVILFYYRLEYQNVFRKVIRVLKLIRKKIQRNLQVKVF